MVVTKDEVNIIKENVASIFSNSRNIFYDKGKNKENEINVLSYHWQRINVQMSSEVLHQNCLMSHVTVAQISWAQQIPLQRLWKSLA